MFTRLPTCCKLSQRVRTMNTAIGIEKFMDLAGDLAGGIAVMRKPVPKPGRGEVLVRLHLRPINPADAMSLAGIFPPFKPAQVHGAVAGLDGTGVVKENGAGASRFHVDQRVVAAPWPSNEGNGTWQQYVVVEEEALVAVPNNMDDVLAAQAFVNPLTAIGIVDVAAVPKGGWLLNSGAATAVGKMIIGAAKVKGIKTINLVRNKNRFEELKALGATEVINVTTEDVLARVKEITGGEGAYAAADCVGGEGTAVVTQSLRDRGTLIAWGAMAGFTTTMFIPDFVFRGCQVRGFLLAAWLTEETPDRQATLEEAMRLIADGTIKLEAEAGRANIEDIDAVREAVMASRKPGQTGRYFIEG